MSAHPLAQGLADPITFAVIKSAFDSIADDMAHTVMRTARSPIVRDVLDYSATLCDPDGQIIAQAKTVALHLGAVPDAMAEVLKRYKGDLAPGDVIVLNDPYAGGMHLPDVFMFKPIFEQDALLGFAVVIAHQCDMGGRVPGSNASDSTEIYQEGLRIPPLKLYRRGVRNAILFAIIERNVRVPKLVLGDIEAQHAACRIGERELQKLVRRYGRATVEAYVRELIDYAERVTRNTIAAWPKGTFGFEDHIDGDGSPICQFRSGSRSPCATTTWWWTSRAARRRSRARSTAPCRSPARRPISRCAARSAATFPTMPACSAASRYAPLWARS
jgi:N-methylhydantoinase B